MAIMINCQVLEAGMSRCKRLSASRFSTIMGVLAQSFWWLERRSPLWGKDGTDEHRRRGFFTAHTETVGVSRDCQVIRVERANGANGDYLPRSDDNQSPGPVWFSATIEVGALQRCAQQVGEVTAVASAHRQLCAIPHDDNIFSVEPGLQLFYFFDVHKC